MVCSPHDAMLAAFDDHGPRIGQRQRQWLFTKDVLATRCCGEDLIAMELVGRGELRRSAFPRRHALLRVAFGCDAFIERALEDPAWGALVARMARSNPSVGETARGRLKEDLARVLDALPGGGLSVDLALEAAIGVVLQVLAAIGEGRLKGAVAQPAVGAVLGAIGIGKQQATTLAKLKRANAALVERAPAA